MKILFQKNKLKMMITIIENLNKQKKKQCLTLSLKDNVALDSIFSLYLFYHSLICLLKDIKK